MRAPARARLPRYLILIPATAAVMFPFYWMVLTSLSTQQLVYQFPPSLMPAWHFENFTRVWQEAPWGRYIVNTVFIAAATTVLVLVTSTLAGYAFASMSFPGKAAVFSGLVAIYMVPTEVTLVPNFITLKNLGWIDTYQAQILPFGASVFGIFLMRQFFLTLPKDLWDSAQLDGAGHFRYLVTIAAPLARPPMITIAILHVVGSWSAFLWPLIVTSSESIRPISVGLQAFQHQESFNPVLLGAAAVITTTPMLVFFLFAQRQLVGGIANTGIRG
jgi:multiple sugar transport system permease protein